MLTQTLSAQAKADIKTRQHLMERSFARAKRYGYKRARWRRLWRVEIQEYLTASIQNIMVLLRNGKAPAASVAVVQAKSWHHRAGLRLKQLSFSFKQAVTRSIKQFFASKCDEAMI